MSLENKAFPTSCVIWPARLDRDGYGTLVVAKRNKRAHRAFYELFVGPIPSGMVVRHVCDTPACVNPAHLIVGTQAENVRDAVVRRRHATGTKNGNSKLSADQVLAIRNGMLCEEAIAIFGIKQSTYYRTRSGDGYKDVADSAGA